MKPVMHSWKLMYEDIILDDLMIWYLYGRGLRELFEAEADHAVGSTCCDEGDPAAALGLVRTTPDVPDEGTGAAG